MKKEKRMGRTHSGFLSALFFVVLAAFANSALAEKYVEISRGAITNDVTLFDADSPKLNPATKGVEFKFRKISDSVVGSGKSVLEYTALGWCSKMTMWYLRVDGVGNGYKHHVKDYYKEGKGWTEYPMVIVANFRHPDGKLLAAACDGGDPAAMDILMQPLGDAECLSPKDPYLKTRCATSSETRADMSLLERRIDAVGQKCGNKPQLRRALEAKSDLLKYCYGGDKCVWDQLKDVVLAVNADLQELEKWESSGSPQPFPSGAICNAEPRLRQADADQQSWKVKHEMVSKTTDAFFACAKRNIAKLDDRKSDAAVIAKVVYRPCSKEFYEAEDARKERDGKADSEQLKKGFEDRLLEMILTNRSASR
jgi:hypothetical protein